MKNRTMLILLVSLFSLCSCSDKELMKREVEAWNKATIKTQDRYSQVKELSTQYADSLESALLYNIYSEDLEVLFYTKAVDYEITDMGMVDENFLQSIKKYVNTDSYDSYLYAYAESKGLEREELYSALTAYYSTDHTENLAKDKDYSDFLYYKPTLLFHDYFTSVYDDTTTEVFIYSGNGGARLSIELLWQNNQIILVRRTV